MKIINSTNNEYIKKIKKLNLLQYRQEQEQFLIEGFHLVNEAINANVLINILVTKKYYKDYQTFDDVVIVSEQVIKSLATTKTPQEIIGICKYNKNKIDFTQPILVLDDIQEPGNLGTLIRTALGFNIKNIVISNNNSADFYNSKVVRSTQGAIFKVNILKTNLPSFITTLKEKTYQIYTTFLHQPHNNKVLEQIKFPLKTCLILGNEANGISQNLLAYSDCNINILTYNNLESLNVAIAGSIIMYQIFYQIFFTVKLP